MMMMTMAQIHSRSNHLKFSEVDIAFGLTLSSKTFFFFKIPPFEIGVCWKYDMIFRETKQSKNIGKLQSLSVWKPKLEPQSEDDKDEWFILGYLALNHGVDPNENIPILTVKAGSDEFALSKPANFKLIHCEKARRTNPKNKAKEIEVFRYWLQIIPQTNYFAMGSIVIEQYQRPIGEEMLDSLKDYFALDEQRKYSQLYALDKVRCIHQKYVSEFGQPLIEKLSTSNLGQFTLHRQSSLALSGIYKLVEMPCIIRKNPNCIEDDIKMEYHSHCIQSKILDLCMKRMQHNLRIVGDSPLIISYATHFRLVWSSDKITTTSNTKAAVWEPVLGPNEFFVGHIAFGDWKHPFFHRNNNKLLIIKSGGSDPDAFKEPLGFECIWSVYSKGTKRRSLSKQKTIGSGLIFSKVGSTVGLIDAEGPKAGSFWRAISPNGYSALGHIALPIDGEVGSTIDSVLRSYNVPKGVCVKDEYLTNFRKLQKQPSLMTSTGTDDIKEDILSNRVRNCIWSSKRCQELPLHAGIYAQEPFSRNIVSPMFCMQGLDEPVENELYSTLILEKVIEAKPYWFVHKAGVLRKRGEGFYAKSQKRYFLLTNEKKMDYWNEIELKGSIDLNEMLRCGICENSSNEFWIETKGRKWMLEVLESDQSTNASEWLEAIRFIANYNHNDDYDDDDGDEDQKDESETSLMSSSINSSLALAIEEKESAQMKIVKLLSKMLKRYAELLKDAKSENETTESVESAVAWYEKLENTRSAIDILLAEWPRGTVCPPGVVRARSELKALMSESVEVILDDIKAYSNENMNDSTILRLHRACCFMESLDGGKLMVSEWITETLLRYSTYLQLKFFRLT